MLSSTNKYVVAGIDEISYDDISEHDQLISDKISFYKSKYLSRYVKATRIKHSSNVIVQTEEVIQDSETKTTNKKQQNKKKDGTI
jgi:hypothetical protein